MMVYDAMWMHKQARDLSLPQPQLPMYYGDAGKKMDKYYDTYRERHPHVDFPDRKSAL